MPGCYFARDHLASHCLRELHTGDDAMTPLTAAAPRPVERRPPDPRAPAPGQAARPGGTPLVPQRALRPQRQRRRPDPSAAPRVALPDPRLQEIQRCRGPVHTARAAPRKKRTQTMGVFTQLASNIKGFGG